jgi:DNA invertase Pin-like site-specific DNA recombinase
MTSQVRHLRASASHEQESGNQAAELRQWVGRRGLEVVTEYVLDGASAGTPRRAALQLGTAVHG